MASTNRRLPWKRANPRKRAGKASKHLSPAQKAAAKARARRAGRRYPNLVDNMRIASASKRGTKKAAKRSKAKVKTKTRAKAKTPRKRA